MRESKKKKYNFFKCFTSWVSGNSSDFYEIVVMPYAEQTQLNFLRHTLEKFTTQDTGRQQTLYLDLAWKKAEAFTSRCFIFKSSTSKQAASHKLTLTFPSIMSKTRVHPVWTGLNNLPTCCKCFTWNTGRLVFYFKITLSMKSQEEHVGF